MENMHTDVRDENLVLFFFFYRSLCAFLNSGKCGTVYLGIHKDGIVAGLKINKKQVCLRVFFASQSSPKKKHLTSSSLSVVKLWKSSLQWFEDRMVSLNEPRNGFVRDKRLSLHLVCKTFHLAVYELPFQGWVSPAVTSQACAQQNECP